MKTILLALALAIAAPLASAQQTAFSVKPATTQWKPSDISSVEIRVRGRLTTDPATTHKILGRVTLKGSAIDWLSALTLRATVLVPASQTWEVKSISILMTPTAATGLASVELITATLTTTHQAPAGKTLAVDFGMATGTVVLGPVDSTPQPPPVIVPTPSSASPDGTKIPPAPSITDASGAVWTALPQVSGSATQIGAARNGARVANSVDYLTIRGGIVFNFDPPDCSQWNGSGWTVVAVCPF